jgi:3-phenylpropionate/trans-cinnamate dioxygenase ferredoxin component
MPWIDACSDAIDAEEAIRFDHGGRILAIYRNHKDKYFCTDGVCTHEDVPLAGGLVIENTIACPKLGSVFDFTTGEVVTPPPACDNLRTYPTRVENGRVMVDI